MVSEHLQEQQQFRGLTAAEVEASRSQFGSNILTPPKRDPWWKLYLEKFEDPIIRVLIIAAGVTIIVGFVDGHFAEGIGIVIAILLATTLSFANEYRARQEFDILNKINDELPINVIRDSLYTTVPRQDLVVGDIVLVEAGDEIAADGQLLEARSLQVNESLLTGESLPVRKIAGSGGSLAGSGTFPPDALFRGTTVVDGRGVMRVSAVGDRSRIGEIAREAISDTDEITPLNAQLERLSKLIGIVGFAVAGMTFTVLVVRGTLAGELALTLPQWDFAGLMMIGTLVALSRVWLPSVYDAFELAGKPRARPAWLENSSLQGWLLTVGAGAGLAAVGVLLNVLLGILPPTPSSWLPGEAGLLLLRYFLIAVTIIVVAVPEGLPMSVTLSLAYSMRRMTATNNLVRRMHACETIGAATVIASDKTGTLTLNQMRVFETQFPAVDGRGVHAELADIKARLIVESMAVNTTANLSRIPGEPIKPLGDTTEGALLLWLDEQGIDYIEHRANFKLIDQQTFSSERKYMGTLGQSSFGAEPVLYIKGAPEIVLARSQYIQSSDSLEALREEDRARLDLELLAYQQRGMRTLGFAYRQHWHPGDVETEIDDLAHDLIWLGFVAIADPIRPDVRDAVQMCRSAGIKVKMVTGDNPATAREIARQIGLLDEDGDETRQIVTGHQFNAVDNLAQVETAANLRVLSRARPLDKMRLVRLLQDRGEVVAVTGDGTNDAPALNYANVGLAMGSGTDIAKEASDIVLLDDSFRSIVNAVMWGRALYENIQRFILFQLTINVAAMGIALLGPFIGVEFPLTVIQMLWVNLIMDTFASLALATEPPHWDVMNRPPRKSTDFIISPVMARGILGLGAAFIALLVGFLLVIQSDGSVTDYELSVFYTVFVLLQFWNLFNARALGSYRSAFAGIGQNKAFVGIALAILLGQVLIVQFGGAIFRTVPLALTDWLLLVGTTSLVLWGGEGWRWLKRRAQFA